MPRLGSSKYIAFMVHDFARWNYYLLLRIVFPGYSWSRLDENHKSMHAQQLSIIEQTLRFKNVHLLILVTRSPFQPACVCWAGADLQGVWMRQRDGTRDKWSETSKPKKTWKGQDFFPFFHLCPSFSIWVLHWPDFVHHIADSSCRPVLLAFGHFLSSKVSILSIAHHLPVAISMLLLIPIPSAPLKECKPLHVKVSKGTSAIQ